MIAARALNAGIIHLTLVGGLVTSAPAHPPIEHQIDRLTFELRTNPSDPDRLLQRGALRRDAKQFEAALADLKSAAQLAPNRLDIAYHHALTYQRMGKVTDALRTIEAALVRAAEPPTADQPAVRPATPISARMDHPYADLLRLEGDILLDVSREAEAANRWQASYERRPRLDLALKLAPLLERVRSADAARAILTDALDRFEPTPDLIAARAKLELRQGQPESAQGHLARFPAQLERFVPLMILNIEALQSAKRPADAERAATRAIRFADAAIQRRPTAFNYYHRAQLRAFLEDRPGAVQDAVQAAKMVPGWVPVRRLLLEIAPERAAELDALDQAAADRAAAFWETHHETDAERAPRSNRVVPRKIDRDASPGRSSNRDPSEESDKVGPKAPHSPRPPF